MDSQLTRLRQLCFFLLLFIISINAAGNEDPVEFEDANLKTAVEAWLRIENPNQKDMLGLKSLGNRYWAVQSEIRELGDLQYAKNLEDLHLEESPVRDFSVLSELNHLESLSLNDCDLSDVSPVVSAIESHSQLDYLSLSDNQISDISPLLLIQTTELEWLDLSGNPLNEDAYQLYIPQLRDKYKGIEIGMPFRMVQLISPSIAAVIFLIGGIVIICHSRTQGGWGFELLTGLISAGVGCYFGLGAQILYNTWGGELPLFGNGYENPMWVGGAIGAVAGCMVGVWFAQYLKGLFAGGYSEGGIIGRSIFFGVVAGVLCSTMVHILLMIAYRNMHFGPLLIGAIFGVGAGIMTGLVVYLVFLAGRKMGVVKVKE